jgi:hypothetical protein
MKNSLRPLTNRWCLFLALSFAAGLMLAPSSVEYLHSQGKEASQDGDTVLEKGRDFTPPVEITLVKSQSGVIEPGRKFTGGEDWFKGLTVTVRNAAEQPITHISLKLLFPRPKGQEGELDFLERLDYGESPIPSEDGRVPVNSARAIMPGESVDIQLSDEVYDSLRALLKESKFPPSIKKIKVDVAMLGFSDGTIWIAGKRYELDKNNPGRLTPLEKKINPA